MVTPNSACPTWLVNLYCAALYLYPKSFRENYREQMLQVFIDNYQRKKKSSPALFLFETLSDLGGSMSQEHLSDFSNNGRIRLAIMGLFLALGVLMLQPFLTSILSDGFEGIANTDNKISDRVFQNYAGHEKEIAQALLKSEDPIKVMVGASHLNGWLQYYLSENTKTEASSLGAPITKALEKAPDNATAWLTAYPLCVSETPVCDADKILSRLQIIAPENGTTWLYHASAAHNRGDFISQEMYLAKANGAAIFDDGNNAINAIWHYAHAETPYKLPWYHFLAQKDLTTLETSVWAIDMYVPGCKDADKSTAAIQNNCREIAKKIARQASSSLSLKFHAYALAVKLGDTDSSAMHGLLEEQLRAYWHYLYSAKNKDVKALAQAYENERQYQYAVKIAEANKQDKYPDVYEF